MPTNATKIQCPECGKDIDINDVLTHQLEKQFTEKFELEREAEKEKISALEKTLSGEKDALEKQKEDLKASIESGVKKEIKSERKKVEAEGKLNSDGKFRSITINEWEIFDNVRDHHTQILKYLEALNQAGAREIVSKKN